MQLIESARAGWPIPQEIIDEAVRRAYLAPLPRRMKIRARNMRKSPRKTRRFYEL